MIEGVKHLIISYLNPKNLLSTPWISSTHIDLDEKLQKPWNSLFMITVKILLNRFKEKINVFKKKKNKYNTLNTMMETHWNAWKVSFFLPKWVRGSTTLSHIVWMLCKVSHSSNGLVNLGPPCLFSANEAPEPPMQCRLLIQYKPKRTLDIRTICPIQNHNIFIHIGYHNSCFLVKKSQLSCSIPPFLTWAWSYSRK